MFENRILRILKEDEEVLRIVKKYAVVFFIPVFVSAILIIAPFFFLYPLFHWSAWGVGIFFIILGIGIVLGLRVFLVYSFNVFIITDKRIIDIDQHGFFDRTVSETTYDKIQDVSFRLKGICQTLFRYGSVIIQTAATQANIELHDIKNPEQVQQTIIEIQSGYAKNSGMSIDDLAKIIKKVNQ